MDAQVSSSHTNVAVLAPFLARWVQNKMLYRVTVWVSAIVGIMSVYNIMAYNPAKPLISDRIDIFHATRVTTQGLEGGSMQEYMQMVYSLPEHAVIGYFRPGLFLGLSSLWRTFFEKGHSLDVAGSGGG